MEFSLAAPGTLHRNHCPWCLWSVHLDQTPGDRIAGDDDERALLALVVRPLRLAPFPV